MPACPASARRNATPLRDRASATDFDFFQTATGADPLRDVEGPIAGFFGGIAEWPGPYEKIPLYLRRFDVCLIPFKVSPLTHGVDPVKLYEYMSLGKPVVSTRFREILPLGDLIYVADVTR